MDSEDIVFCVLIVCVAVVLCFFAANGVFTQ